MLRRSDFIAATYALSLVLANFGIAIAARMPMMTTTIRSSIRVKPFLLLIEDLLKRWKGANTVRSPTLRRAEGPTGHRKNPLFRALGLVNWLSGLTLRQACRADGAKIGGNPLYPMSAARSGTACDTASMGRCRAPPRCAAYFHPRSPAPT